jgi:hypothetical protein
MEHRAMGRYRRLVIAFAVALLLIGAYGAAGFLAVPYYARKFLQDFVRTHYARVLGIGEIHFNPFTLTLDVRHLVLPDADGQTLLSFERLHVDLQLASLWRFGPSFRGILLEQPYVRAVIRPNGALNLADLGKGFPAEPARAEQKSAPLRLSIGRLAVISGTANFEDRTRPTPFRAEFKPIAFELRDFSTTRRTENDYALNAVSPEGERLICSGTLRLEPLAAHGVFEISDLKARTVWNYLRARLPFEIDSGMIGIKGDYDLGSAGGPIGLKLNVRSTTLRSLGIKPKGATQNSIDVARIEVDETRIDLTKHSVEVAKVTLAGGDIKAWLSEQGRLNLLDLGGSPEAVHGTAAPQAAAGASVSPTPAASAAAPVSSGDAASAWSVSAPDLTLQGFKVSAEDRQMRPAAVLLLSPLNIHVAGFNTSPEDILDITLDAGVNTSGKINARAKVTPKSGAVSAHVEAADLGLTMLQPYIARYTSMTLLQGALGSRLDIERQADGTLAVKGNSHVADLRTVDNALKQDFIKWKDLRVADILYLSKPASLRIGSITALEPYVRMIIAPDRTLNVKQVLTPPGAVATGPAPEAERAPVADPSAAGGKKAGAAGGKKAPAAGGQGTSVQTAAAPGAAVTPFPVSIGTIRFVNGSANYTDLWIKPSFAIGIRTLGGTVSGLSSDPRSRAKVQLDGKVERYSPIQIAGQVNLLSAALYADLKVSFRDLDLTVVNPYAGYFAGYRIDKGKLSVDVSYRIEQRKLTAAQHFLVDQLQLGERVDSADATHLPLKLAVALLKDRNGVIDLDLPMSGSLDDPTFSIGPILWKMFVNLIVKAATAPFALLGHLFGGGEHVNVVEFHAGSAELDQPAKEQLAALAKALKERPQLNLDIPVVFSKGLERPQIAAMRLREELLARVQNTRQGRKHPETAGELALADPAKHFSLLLEQYHADLGKDAPLPPTAVAVQQAKGKEAPPYDPAIADLNAALIDHIQVPDSDLEALGKQRAQAIRDALVSAGQIEPTRLFIVNAPPKPDSGDTVKVEMAVK